MTLIKTYSPKNEAVIVCPIFNAETKIADCISLEQKLARGEVQPERKGCQACLRSSKCPIYWINRDIRANGEDLYYASEPRTVGLKDKHLSAISAILVREDVMTEMGVIGDERDAIFAANEAASSGAKARSSRKAPAVKLSAVKREEPTVKPAKVGATEDDAFKAAVTGDMSAAITKASQKAQEAPAPEPAPVAPAKPAPAPAPKPAPAITAPAPAPAGKGMSLLEMARARAAQKAAA